MSVYNDTLEKDKDKEAKETKEKDKEKEKLSESKKSVKFVIDNRMPDDHQEEKLFNEHSKIEKKLETKSINQNEEDNENVNNNIEEEELDFVNDERQSTVQNDLNESIVSSNIASHTYTPKMIQNIKSTDSFYSSFENVSRIDTQNQLITMSFSNEVGSSNINCFENEMDMQQVKP